MDQTGLSRMGRGKKEQLSFPPLTANWTVRGEPNWPGAEYTRRTRLKTKCEGHLSTEFLAEMKSLLGDDNYGHFTEAMRPSEHPTRGRGNPPLETGKRPIQPAYTLRRAEGENAMGGTAGSSLMSTTRSQSGQMSKTRFLEHSHTPWGVTPAYMFEDREQMDSLSQWFERYGKPAATSSNREVLYTRYQPLSKRVCGEPSCQQVMKKGTMTR